jgi:hypothetical protein
MVYYRYPDRTISRIVIHGGNIIKAAESATQCLYQEGVNIIKIELQE